MLQGLEDEAVQIILDFVENRKGVDASMAELSEEEKGELLTFSSGSSEYSLTQNRTTNFSTAKCV